MEAKENQHWCLWEVVVLDKRWCLVPAPKPGSLPWARNCCFFEASHGGPRCQDRSNPQLHHPFPPVPEAQAWLELFKEDSLRYPILVVLGPSRAGKTEWAKSLFSKPLQLKIGTLQFFPYAMRHFQRDVHDGLVLDDLRNLQFLVDHQEKLQGKYDSLVEFGSTAGGNVLTMLTYLASLWWQPQTSPPKT